MARTAGAGLIEYIEHHLAYLNFNEGHGWFSVLHLDSILIVAGLALLFVVVLTIAARRATCGDPGRFQAAVEIPVEMVDDTVTETFHGKSALIAPLAIGIFGLAFLMNRLASAPSACQRGSREILRQAPGPACGRNSWPRSWPSVPLQTRASPPMATPRVRQYGLPAWPP